ncbi:SIS domain-containing protein [Nocardioides sp.]|uniref:SIS domain-containing protein n=1 Tax=Nocardioides sp. TaxID=35761 RepID=UPI002CB407AD|nr:SIS domain-containing protein [Nocardioides sp.]HSX66738.1 SIS domain-containing protein [Nocardioides sp.]
MTYFDEARLDDATALAAADLRLRELAESGARVRREAGEAAEAIQRAAGERGSERPRAVIAAGPDSRLLRAVLEPWCPVPFVAWPNPGLPGWAGSLDLVVMLAPQGSDPAAASAVAEAVRRGCQVVVACRPGSMVAEHADGRWSTLLPATTGDQLATAVVMLDLLHRVGLGPACDADEVAAALDHVALESSPHQDLAENPAKELAIALADALPLVWGGSTLGARAARRVAEQIRRASGRSALAGDAEHLLPVIEATRPRNLFDDPVDDVRPLLLVLDDGADDPVVREQRGRLQAAAARSGVRVETLASDAGSEVARYASLLLSGTYAAEYLGVGLAGE